MTEKHRAALEAFEERLKHEDAVYRAEWMDLFQDEIRAALQNLGESPAREDGVRETSTSPAKIIDRFEDADRADNASPAKISVKGELNANRD